MAFRFPIICPVPLFTSLLFALMISLSSASTYSRCVCLQAYCAPSASESASSGTMAKVCAHIGWYNITEQVIQESLINSLGAINANNFAQSLQDQNETERKNQVKTARRIVIPPSLSNDHPELRVEKISATVIRIAKRDTKRASEALDVLVAVKYLRPCYCRYKCILLNSNGNEMADEGRNATNVNTPPSSNSSGVIAEVEEIFSVFEDDDKTADEDEVNSNVTTLDNVVNWNTTS